MATEAYEKFADSLQKEIEEDMGIRFGILDPHQFAGVKVEAADGKVAPLGFGRSKVFLGILSAKRRSTRT